MEGLSVGDAAGCTGWSPRMLRYLERAGLVVPRRTASGYREYGLRELNQLQALRRLRDAFGLGIAEMAFAARLDREPVLRAAVSTWLAGSYGGDWVDWEQRKQERLLAA
jgi:MerR family transcriptional regulator, copper efflux regulator